MKNQYLFATDVGTSSIKVIVGQVKPDGLVTVLGIGTAPADGFVKGVITDIQALAKSIRQALDCASVATNVAIGPVHLGISGDAVRFYTCRGSVSPVFPERISQEDINRASRAAIVTGIPEESTILHTVPIGYWLDGVKVEDMTAQHKGSRLEVEVCIAALDKRIEFQLERALQDREVMIADIHANAFAASNFSSAANQYIVIDMGAGTTDLAFYSKQHLETAATLLLGGDYITHDIAQGVGVSRAHAEEIKRYYAKLNSDLYGQDVILDCNDYGTTDKHVAYDFLHHIVESRVQEIVELVYEQAAPVLQGHEEIILTGGCCYLPSLKARLELLFGIPVRLAPLEALLPEYAFYTNTAVYGLVEYAATRKLPQDVPNETVPSGMLDSFWERVKSFF